MKLSDRSQEFLRKLLFSARLTRKSRLRYYGTASGSRTSHVRQLEALIARVRQELR